MAQSESGDGFDVEDADQPGNLNTTTRLLRVINEIASQDKLQEMEVDIDLELEDLLDVEDAIRALLDELAVARPELDGKTAGDFIDRESIERVECVLTDILDAWAQKIKEALRDRL
ncbi:MAG: hypothetical protein ACOCVS_03210 [Planctomycetota bacterium]